MLLEELPPVLVLHLKWFTYDKNGGLQKCIKQVDFDIDLEIGKGWYCFSSASFITDRRGIVEQGGCFQRRLFVSLFE